MSVPAFLGVSDYVKCIEFYQSIKKEKKKFKAQFEYTKEIFINEYVYFLVFFITEISIFRNLNHTDA